MELKHPNSQAISDIFTQECYSMPYVTRRVREIRKLSSQAYTRRQET
jgi:hypothetical protein